MLPATRHKWTAPPWPQPVSWYSICLPRRDGRLSWPRLPGNALAGSQTHDLLITSLTPHYYTTEPARWFGNVVVGRWWVISVVKVISWHNSEYTLSTMKRQLRFMINCTSGDRSSLENPTWPPSGWNVSIYGSVYLTLHPLQHFSALDSQELLCNYETTFWCNVGINKC